MMFDLSQSPQWLVYGSFQCMMFYWTHGRLALKKTAKSCTRYLGDMLSVDGDADAAVMARIW